MKKIITYLAVPFVLALTISFISITPLACSGGAAQCNPVTVGCVIAGSLVDCTGVTSLDTAVPVVEPIVANLIDGARNADGSINWPSIESKLESLAWQYGMCVIAEIWNDLVNGGGGSGSGSRSGSAVTAKLKTPLDTGDAKKEFDRIRAHVAPGYAFKLKSGGTL